MSMLVGLTGGMGSGKTLAAKIFHERSAHIIDADSIARDLVYPNRPAWEEIVQAFGREILLKNGEIDRSLLGRIVFENSTKRKILEEILHPRVFAEEYRIYQDISKKNIKALIIVDAALLIESGNHKNMDKIVVIACNKQERIRRLLKRDTLTLKEIQKRFQSQMKIDDKIKFADYIIDNNGSVDGLEKQVERLYHELKSQL